VATLGLAIGANVALFGLVDAVLLARLPFPGADSIVRVWEERLPRGWSRFGVSAPAFQDWSREARSFEALAAYTRRSANLAQAGEPRRVEVLQATPSLLAVLGLRPRHGRFFYGDEARRGGRRVAVLSHEFWTASYGGDPGAIGGTVMLDGESYEVVGVLPPESAAAFDRFEIATPLSLEGEGRRGARWLEVMGRVARGATLESASAELAVLARRHEADHPETNTGWTTAVVPLQEVRTDGPRPLLLAVWAGVLLVLLVTWANLAGLMAGRAADREPELAIRTALGASPGRLLRLMATESLMLALLGGVAAAGVAVACRAVLVTGLEAVLGSAPPAASPSRLALFLGVTTLVSSVAFGIAPALRARVLGLEPRRHAAGRGATRSRLGLRRLLVAGEVAVAVVLVSAAGLLVRSLERLLQVPSGFETKGALSFRVAPVQSSPAEGESEEEFVRAYLAERDRTWLFYERLLEALRELPGVTAAGAVNRMPLTGRWWSIGVVADGEPSPAPGETPSVAGRVVTPGYFEAVGTPLRAGRVFTAKDVASAPAVAVVSESLARQMWSGREPLGRVLVVDERLPATVVGVVADARVNGLDAAAPAIVYVPFAQATFGLFPDWGLDVVVRTSGGTTDLSDAIRRAVASLDPTLPVFALRTLDDVLGGWMARRKAAAVLIGAFAVVAAVLAMVGLHGVMSHSVRQRRREIGVRLAVGARPRDIGGLVLGEGLVLAAAGVAVGLATSTGTSRLLASLLFEVRPEDPLTALATAAVVAILALAAAGGPSWQASRADPVAVLREDG
jgi:putative ABC transport system permease protein